MVEHLPGNTEHDRGSETLSPVEHQSSPEKAHNKELHPKQRTNETDIEAIQKKIEAAATLGQDIKVEDKAEPQPDARYVNRELKLIALNRSLARVRKHLALPERTLSRVVHKPTVEAISNLGAKTIARPAGILAGGFFGLFGSLIAVYISRHYGFSYNRLLLFGLFVGGYVIGLIIELAAHLLFRKKRQIR